MADPRAVDVASWQAPMRFSRRSILRGGAALSMSAATVGFPSVDARAAAVARNAQSGTRWHAVLWEQGEIFDLGDLDASQWGDSYAYDINNAGQVVGHAVWKDGDREVRHAVLWDDDGQITDLTASAQFDWDARGAARLWYETRAINDAGQIIGYMTIEGEGSPGALVGSRSDDNARRPRQQRSGSRHQQRGPDRRDF